MVPIPAEACLGACQISPQALPPTVLRHVHGETVTQIYRKPCGFGGGVSRFRPRVGGIIRGDMEQIIGAEHDLEVGTPERYNQLIDLCSA